jgi:hypothetical protein
VLLLYVLMLCIVTEIEKLEARKQSISLDRQSHTSHDLVPAPVPPQSTVSSSSPSTAPTTLNTTANTAYNPYLPASISSWFYGAKITDTTLSTADRHQPSSTSFVKHDVSDNMSVTSETSVNADMKRDKIAARLEALRRR